MKETKDEETQRLLHELMDDSERFYQANKALVEILPAETFNKVLQAMLNSSRRQTYQRLKRLEELGALGKTEPGWYERAMKELEQEEKKYGKEPG